MATQFEVQYVVTARQDSIIESIARYEFRVIDSFSGRQVMCFCGEDRGSCQSWCSRGTVNCKLNEEAGVVETIDSRGQVEAHSLPQRLH